jgi:acetyl esterase
MYRMSKNQRGFSLVEAILVVAVFAFILTVAGKVAFGSAQTTSPLHLNYSKNAGEDMYVFKNTTPNPEPSVILVHGGGWSAGDAKGMNTDSQELATAGYVVFNINYPLDSSSQPGYPVQENAVVAATNWVIKNGARYGADTQRVNLLGGSSGATLAIHAAERVNTTKPHTVLTATSLSGRMDFLNFEQDLGGGYDDSFNPTVNIPQYLGCSFNSCSAAEEKAASPVDHVNANCPAFLLFNSQAEDMPLDQAQKMQNVAQKHACAVTLQIVPGNNHAFAYYNQVLPQIEQFLAAYNRAPPSPAVKTN